MLKEGAQAVLVLETPVPFAHQKKIGDLAIAKPLPAMFPGGQADAGGLLTYGTSVADAWPPISVQADKIFKGTKPADIPVEVITRRDLIVNLRTAEKIGVPLSEDVRKQANRVID